MNNTTASTRSAREHISTFPNLQAELRLLGVVYITFRYLDGDPCGSVYEIEYFGAGDEYVQGEMPADLQVKVQTSIERDALQFLQGRWVGCGDQEICWRI